MTQTTSADPGDILMKLIVALLAPMFLGVTAGEIGLARAAAAETVNAYRARNNADLIAIAQIIAFGLATLGSLSQSMEDDISIQMALRLRGNANALNRSAEQNRRALRENLSPECACWERASWERATDAASPHRTPAEAVPPFIITEHDAEALLSAAAAQVLAAESEARLCDPQPAAATAPADNRRHQSMWAIAMVKEASESMPAFPTSHRRSASPQRCGPPSSAAPPIDC